MFLTLSDPRFNCFVMKPTLSVDGFFYNNVNLIFQSVFWSNYRNEGHFLLGATCWLVGFCFGAFQNTTSIFYV